MDREGIVGTPNVEGERGDAADFARMGEAFERACRATPVSVADLDLAGAHVRLRVAGTALAPLIQRPFAHRLLASPTGAPLLTIDLWDARATGVGAPARATAASGRSWDLGDAVLAASPGARFVSYAARGGVIWFDRGAPRIVGVHAAAEQLSLHQRVRPLQSLLGLWANDRGLEPVHAALVARAGRGVLIAGRTGAGKSTVALAALAAGYTYLGDDSVLFEIGSGGCIGHGLYASVALEPEHARRFPFLARHLVAPRADEPKAHALLSEPFRERLAGRAAIAALALTRVVDSPRSSVAPASPGEALLGLVPSSIFASEPRGGRESVARLAALARRVPAWRLEVGRTLADLPRCLDTILDAAPARGRT